MVFKGRSGLPMSTSCPFGERSWRDVNAEITKRLTGRYRYRLSTPHDLEEAVAGAMLDLVDYWVHVPSSLSATDPERNFKWAVWRGLRTATTLLVQKFREREGVFSLSDVDGEDEDYIPRSERLAGQGPGPDEMACDVDEAAQVRALIDELPPIEHERWLDSLLEGLSTYECAQRSGLSAEAERRRRNSGVERARRIARKKDL